MREGGRWGTRLRVRDVLEGGMAVGDAFEGGRAVRDAFEGRV